MNRIRVSPPSAAKRWFLRAATFAAVGLLSTGTIAPEGASAEGLNQAAVIIDSGTEVKTAVVSFPEDSISGLELLRRAGFDPVTYSYSGLGAAVCAMCGKGCAADSSCLTCDGGNYWSYFRAPVGNSTFVSSRVGASAAMVSDGDIEGWRYGTGGAPVFQDLLGRTTSSSSVPASTPPVEAPSASSPAPASEQSATLPSASSQPPPALVPASSPVPPSASVGTIPDVPSSAAVSGGVDPGLESSQSGGTSSSASSTSASKQPTKSVVSRDMGRSRPPGGGGNSPAVPIAFAVAGVGALVTVEMRRKRRGTNAEPDAP